MVGRLVAIIHEATHTGRAGDGVVWVTAVESFERLRLPLSEVD
jgi:nitrogen regulatory protein PII